MNPDPLGQGQNILSLDICSTTGSQIEDDLSTALKFLHRAIKHVEEDRLALETHRLWARQAKAFAERFAPE